MLEKLFGVAFVHGKCTAYIVASGIFNIHQFKHRLNLAIFPVFSVKCHEHHVRRAADLYHIVTDPAGIVLLAALFNRFDVRCGFVRCV